MLRKLPSILKESVVSWFNDYAPSMGAALAYYTMFSIAPLLLIVITVAGWVFGPEAARGEIVAQLSGMVGDEGATAIEGLLQSVSKPGTSIIAAVFGIVLLIFGATTVFAELQSDLDRIWETPERAKPSGIWGFVRARFLSFGMILGITFLLIISLVVSAAISALGNWYGPWFKGYEAVLRVVDFVVSFGLFTCLFAMIYKFMPTVRIAWRDVWVGAAFTTLLFVTGKILIGLYIGKSGVASGFGAAASLVVLLIWVYYSAQIFLLGAEFTHAWWKRLGSGRGARSRAEQQRRKLRGEAVPT